MPLLQSLDDALVLVSQSRFIIDDRIDAPSKLTPFRAPRAAFAPDH
jgi:hypothetical protein